MKIAPYIDHTLLRANAEPLEILNLCWVAKEYRFAAVCVNSCWVSQCYESLAKSKVKICTVVGFPLGANLSEVKSFEAETAVEYGAAEIDMVINIGGLKSGYWLPVEKDISLVRKTIPKAVLKVIIETCLLTDNEKETACKIAQNAGADFVKTSTGFSTGGATIEDVKLIRKVVGSRMGVKAAGGIKDFKTAKAMIEAGANRLGCSAGVAIVEEEKQSRVH